MNILVTGHHGYIGSVTTPVLTTAGHDVFGFDTFFYEGCDFGRDGSSIQDARVDVRDVAPDQLEGFDAIVHLAALSNDPLGDLHSDWTYDINLNGTLSLARAAKRAGVPRFVFASSCSMYGASTSDELLDETAPLRPLTPYAESKVRAEEGLRELADADFSPVYMRNATAYGVSPRLRLDVVLNNLAAWAHTTGKVRLLSDGRSWRPLVHVEDIARATAAILAAPRPVVHDQAFNVGSQDQNVQVRELADGLRELLGCEVETSHDATADPRSYRVDFTKLTTSLGGFECEWNVRSGASQLVDAYASVGLTYDDFVEKGKYTRLVQLKKLVAHDSLDGDLRWTASAGDGRRSRPTSS